MSYRITTDRDREPQSLVYLGALTSGPDPLPAQYSLFNYAGYIDPGTYCLSVSMKQDADDFRKWDAVATFGPMPANQTPVDQVTNPLNRPVKYWLETMEIVEPVTVDIADKPLRNSAKQEFVDPLMQEEHITVLCGQYNVANLQTVLNLNETYAGTVNNAEFKDAAEYRWKCLPIQAGQIQFENGFAFYSPVIRIAKHPVDWRRRVVDQGFQHLDAGGRLVHATDENGEPVSEPVLLLSDGTRSPAGIEGRVKVFETRRKTDFTKLGI